VPVLEAPAPVPGTALGVAAPVLSAQAERIVDASLRCFARWGVAKTTLDDIAREAGYSRATVYRFFPGGKDGLIDEIAAVEVARAFAQIGSRLDAATDLEDLIVSGMTEASRVIAGHRPLQYLLEHEPEVVLPRISFHAADDVLRAVSAFAAPYLARFLPAHADAARAAEWVARIVLSYTCCPSAAVDLSSETATRTLVRAFVLPGLTN
jgi:AcrR family transcriptional regulator